MNNPVHPKVKAVGLSGAIVTVVAFVLAALDVEIPDGVLAAAVTVLLTFAGYEKEA